MSNQDQEIPGAKNTLVSEAEIAIQTYRWETSILRIYKDQRFYRSLLQYIPQYQDLKIPSVAWVAPGKDSSLGVKLGYNPALLGQITDNISLMYVQLHEINHIVLHHLTRTRGVQEWCKSEDRVYSQELDNIAMDIANNDLLIAYNKEVAGGQYALTPESYFMRTGQHTHRRLNEQGDLVEGPYARFEKCQTYEYYFKNLCSKHGATPGSASAVSAIAKEIAENLAKGGIPDAPGTHDLWEDGDISLIQEAIMEEKVREAIKEATAAKTIGKGSFSKMLEELYPIRETKYDWASLLKRSLKSGKFHDKRTNPHKLNRRMQGVPVKYLPTPLPAKAKVRDFSLVWITDTSGSMSPEDIMAGYSAGLGLKSYKPGLVFWAIEWDCIFQREFEIRTKADIRNHAPNMQGRGGTDFSAAIKYAIDKYRPDTLVYATDGYGCAGDREVTLGVNFIWLITKGGASPCDWGTQIYMKKD